LESLVAILPAERAKAFFSPAQLWKFVDRTGNLVSITTTFNAQENLPAPFILDQQQEFALLEASEIDQVIDLLRKNLPKLMAAVPMSDRPECVGRIIALAKREGVISIADLALCAAVFMMKGEAFMSDPNWLQLLNKIKQGDLDVTDGWSMIDSHQGFVNL
jgi:hypothetical protein